MCRYYSIELSNTAGFVARWIGFRPTDMDLKFDLVTINAGAVAVVNLRAAVVNCRDFSTED